MPASESVPQLAPAPTRGGVADVSLGVPFMSFQEVAELLRVHVATVRRWVRSGALPSVKLGARCVRFRPADVAAFIDAAARAGRGL